MRPSQRRTPSSQDVAGSPLILILGLLVAAIFFFGVPHIADALLSISEPAEHSIDPDTLNESINDHHGNE